MPELKTDKKTGITYRQWNFLAPKAVLLLVHGLGAHSERWSFLADFFLKSGYSSYALELRGFGQTRDIKGDIRSFNIYLDDVCSLWRILAKENPGKKVFVIGESMGALIVFLAAVRWPALFRGAILLSPVLRSRLKMPTLNYLKVFLSLFYNPRKQISVSFDSKMCTQDAAYQKIMDSDPREHRLATARLLSGILFSQLRVQFLKDRILTPILFLLSGKDAFADIKASRRFFKELPIKDKEIILYPQMLHALSIELEREKVFGDVLRWMERRI